MDSRIAHHIFDNALKEIKEKDVGKSEQFDNSSALSYNFRKKVDNENGREKANQENEERVFGRRSALHNNREAGTNISVSFNDGRSESLRTITTEEKSKRINEIANAIYYNATNEIQNNLKWHCKYEGVELFFLKTKEGVEQSFVYDGKNLFIKENATEKELVDILNVLKPIKREVDENKIAHISNKRWDYFINNHSGAYLTRIPIQQFLDMTTESYVDQRQINARSESISRQANVNVSDTYQEDIYLEIDFNTKKVVNHEGRHRLTSLLNQGNAFVDIFIIPTQKLNIETITNIEIEGQFNNNKYKLSFVKAESVIFKDAIYNSFRREDNNIRYSLKDSDGNELSPEQQEYFNNRAPTKNPDIRFSKKGGVVVNLSNDNVLQNKIAGSTKSKYDVIREYLIESFIGEALTLSDGIEAIMDKSDAKHLAHLSDNKKTATLSRLREVIEKAQLFSVANKVGHKKFDAFRYYEVRVSFGDEEYDILLNVGHSKFKDEYHIYDITKKGSVANESSTRLARSVDYALKNNTSTNIIRNSEENVNTNSENFSNQIKLSRKANPTYTLSDGQVKKKIADYARLKYYSKIESEKTINCILETYFNFEEYDVKLSGKTKAEAIDVLSKKLNTFGIRTPKAKVLLKVQ